MNLNRIRRLIRIIGLLQSGRGQTVDALALECGVHRRTIFRDLNTLRDAGVPIAFDQERQLHRIVGRYYLPPTNLTAEEALAVIVLCHELGAQRPVPMTKAAHSAALKLEQSLPANLREHVRKLSTAVAIKVDGLNPLDGKGEHFEKLLDAVARRRPVRIEYNSFAERRVITTKLSPYQLFFGRRSWYVVGRSSLHRAVRTFNLSRVEELKLLDDGYVPPPRGFSLERYLGNAWRMIPEPGPDYDVEIRFRPQVAGNVAEVAWHKTQRIEHEADGSILFRATVSGLKEIVWWVLGYGAEAEVLEPPELRALLGEHAERMAAQYRGA